MFNRLRNKLANTKLIESIFQQNKKKFSYTIPEQIKYLLNLKGIQEKDFANYISQEKNLTKTLSQHEGRHALEALNHPYKQLDFVHIFPNDAGYIFSPKSGIELPEGNQIPNFILNRLKNDNKMVLAGPGEELNQAKNIKDPIASKIATVIADLSSIADQEQSWQVQKTILAIEKLLKENKNQDINSLNNEVFKIVKQYQNKPIMNKIEYNLLTKGKNFLKEEGLSSQEDLFPYKTFKVDPKIENFTQEVLKTDKDKRIWNGNEIANIYGIKIPNEVANDIDKKTYAKIHGTQSDILDKQIQNALHKKYGISFYR